MPNLHNQPIKGDGKGRSATAAAASKTSRHGWKNVALRVQSQITQDRVSMVAASVAFYAMLAIFPAMIALVLLYGLVSDPMDVQSHLMELSSILPEEARAVLETQMRAIVGDSERGVGLGFVVSIVGALWAASRGMKALIVAMNIAYGEQERRGLVKRTLAALGLTVAAILFVLVAIFVAAALPAIFEALGLGAFAQTVLNIVRWPVLAVLAIVGLSFVYHYAPARDIANWRWVTWGSAIATLVWLIGTAGFSFYVSNFGNYNKTYGTLGGVIILMLWFYLTSYSVILGAEIDAELDHQTARDGARERREPAPAAGTPHHHMPR
jgi:membrane protein